MPTSLADRVAAARAKSREIAEGLSSAQPPAHERNGVAAALVPLREQILSAIARGWCVADLAKHLAANGVAFSVASLSKAVDEIVDDALRAEITSGTKAHIAVKRVVGIDLVKANSQVKARFDRRLARLTHTRSRPSKRGTNNNA